MLGNRAGEPWLSQTQITPCRRRALHWAGTMALSAARSMPWIACRSPQRTQQSSSTSSAPRRWEACAWNGRGVARLLGVRPQARWCATHCDVPAQSGAQSGELCPEHLTQVLQARAAAPMHGSSCGDQRAGEPSCQGGRPPRPAAALLCERNRRMHACAFTQPQSCQAVLTAEHAPVRCCARRGPSS